MIYLIHFSRKYKHARHYLGYASSVAARVKRHKAGNGARLMAVVTAAGIPWRVVRRWTGKAADRNAERRLKENNFAKDLCPICSGAAAFNRGRL